MIRFQQDSFQSHLKGDVPGFGRRTKICVPKKEARAMEESRMWCVRLVEWAHRRIGHTHTCWTLTNNGGKSKIHAWFGSLLSWWLLLWSSGKSVRPLLLCECCWFAVVLGWFVPTRDQELIDGPHLASKGMKVEFGGQLVDLTKFGQTRQERSHAVDGMHTHGSLVRMGQVQLPFQGLELDRQGRRQFLGRGMVMKAIQSNFTNNGVRIRSQVLFQFGQPMGRRRQRNQRIPRRVSRGIPIGGCADGCPIVDREFMQEPRMNPITGYHKRLGGGGGGDEGCGLLRSGVPCCDRMVWQGLRQGLDPRKITWVRGHERHSTQGWFQTVAATAVATVNSIFLWWLPSTRGRPSQLGRRGTHMHMIVGIKGKDHHCNMSFGCVAVGTVV